MEINEGKNLSGQKESTLLSKVPQVTAFFWIIKVLCTTVGETASDFLNVNLGFGLTGTSIVAGVLLIIALFFQFRAKKYIPGLYWVTVVLISIFGTLVTDNMTDAMGVPLEVSTIVFSALLAVTFFIWYRSEKTLSIHSIFTVKREAFYWLAILFTFALGTASGDLMAESLGLGYLTTGIIVVAVIISVSIAWKLGLDSVLSFWIAYIMTRPLGASVGDYLSQPVKFGGLGLGATVTSVIFLLAILLTVIFLSLTKRDTRGTRTEIDIEKPADKGRKVFVQVIVVLCIFAVVGGAGYTYRHAQLLSETAAGTAETQTVVTESPSAASGSESTGSANRSAGSVSAPLYTSKLGDLSEFVNIEEDTLALVNSGDMSGAKTRVGDLEFSWDKAEASLKPKDSSKWSAIDGTIDTVLRQVRAVNPNAASCKKALENSLSALKS